MTLTVSLVWSVSFCLIGATAAAQSISPLPLSSPSQEGFSNARLQRLGSFMQTVVAPGNYLGAVTLISRNGKIVDWRTYGHRDLAMKMPMTRDAIFRIYSMTKTITSVAVLILMEEGKLGLEDPVGKFIPDFSDIKVFSGGTAEELQLRPAKKPITIRQLLTHTGGFATRGEKDGAAGKLFNRIDLHQLPTLAAYADYVARQPLATDPGEQFNYDGVSIEVASHLVEAVSGMSFEAYLHQRILTPLKMNDTGFSVPLAKRGRVADMVTTTADGRLVIAATHDAAHPGEPLNPYPSGAGGLYSTAGDYLRFCQMLLNGGSLDGVSILGRKTVELMMMNHLADASVPEGALGKGEGFGLGGYVVVDVARRGRPGSLGQFGWSGAGSTYYTIDREEKLIAMLLMQHLPQGLPNDPPKVSVRFYNAVYQSLVH
ncbi:MAG: serine hydrolase domain-containing protein [Betaproteobacteria bacterium]